MQAPKKFDYTAMGSFLRCRRRYYFRHVRDLVGLGRMTAVEFGKSIHAALDVWHTERDIDKAIQIFKNSFVPDPEDDKRTVPVAEKLLKLYAEKYAHESFKILQTEKQFEMPLPNDTTLIGRIDKIIDWDGAIYVLDHKTTSRLGYEFFYKIKPNMQFDGYILAARYLGYPTCSGIVLDALLVAKGLITPAQLAKLTPLARDISTRSENELDTYMKNTLSIISDIQKCYLTEDWYRNTEACCDFIQCPYRNICKEEESVQEQIIASDYRIEPWTPLEDAA
jgi:hypothetical protein